VPTVTFEGTVFSGRGEGKKLVGLPWVKRQIQQKLGFVPYAGTLNIRLTEEGRENRKLLDASEGFLIEPQTGYFPGVLFRASIAGLKCGVVVPKVPRYPGDVLEVIAPLYLRGELGILDGSLVSVMVTF
jgi:riboflavin kinase